MIFHQYLLPQHLLSRLTGKLAQSQMPWLKNLLIRAVIKHFDVDMSIAEHPNPEDYPDFNTFFTRALKPGVRPIVTGDDEIACPVDGFVSEIGHINDGQLLQAKGQTYSVETLLAGNSAWAELFDDGEFATLYLSPKDYHRVHMPLAGRLTRMAYVPGKLFSVNKASVGGIPNLFARNERVVCLFETAQGPMAVILVGAMLVASMVTVWHGVVAPDKCRLITTWDYADKDIELKKGDELGRFQYGSTAIVLLPKNIASWNPELTPDTAVKMGSLLGKGGRSQLVP